MHALRLGPIYSGMVRGSAYVQAGRGGGARPYFDVSLDGWFDAALFLSSDL